MTPIFLLSSLKDPHFFLYSICHSKTPTLRVLFAHLRHFLYVSAPGIFANLDPSVPPFRVYVCVCVWGGECVFMCVCGGVGVSGCGVFLSGNGWGVWGGWGVCFI